jgi:predicted nucleic acid-binding protein
MRKLKIYLDTSIISFLYADDSPDYKKATEEFFEEYINQYDVYITDFVIAELDNTRDEELRNKFLNVIRNYHLQVLSIEDDQKEFVITLARKYIQAKIIPESKIDDAIHIAICTIYEFDILLSWNFKHIANIKKQIQINTINMQDGYLKELYLINPLEVNYEDKDT